MLYLRGVAVLLLALVTGVLAAMPRPVIVVPGMLGVFLNNEDGERVWYKLTDSLFNTSDNRRLRLPTNWTTVNGNRVQGKDALTATELMWHADLSEMVGGYGVLRTYVELNEGQVFGFAYDWRRDPNEHVTALYKYIKNVYSQLGKVQVVGHSLGGMILLAAINTNKDLLTMIDTVIYAAVPFEGNPWHVRNLLRGFPVLNDDQSLGPEPVFTWPSSYVYFSTKWLNPTLDFGFISSTTGAPITMDMFNISNWVNYKLGLNRHRNLTALELTHLENSLAQAKLFRTRMEKWNPANHPKCAYITGDSYQTPWNVRVKPDFSDILTAQEGTAIGDLLVAYELTRPAATLRCKPFDTFMTHWSTLQDYDTLQDTICDMGNCPTDNGAATTVLSLIAILLALVVAVLNM